VLHIGIGADYDPGKFYFISVRDPYEQYLSLYSFGCQRKGKLFKRLSKQGLAHLYDGTAPGFHAWLKFILDANSAAHLPGYGERHLKNIVGIVGLQSYRVLQLAMRDAEQILATCQDRANIRLAFNANNIVQHTIRTETLRDDLVNLLTTNLAGSLTDLEDAKRYVTQEGIRNPSRRVDETWKSGGTEAELRALVRDREWPLCEFFGY
jgi:hypothetical protein